MGRRVFYVAHPVSFKPDIGASWSVTQNVSNAKRWMAWLIQNDRKHVYIAPWIVEVEQWLKNRIKIEYTDALRDDEEVVRRCDGLIMVGGVITPGMDHERKCALLEGLEVIDISKLRSPPVKDSVISLNYYLIKTLLNGVV